MNYRGIIRNTVTAFFLAVTVSCFAQNALYIPPTLSGTNFNLNVQTGTVQFYAGYNTPTFGVNGNILAPTLILNKGDSVTMNVTNNLVTTTTTMHWHGLHVPAMADGGPHQIITQGSTWSPSFKVMNDAGTYWYHPHGQNKTDMQVSKGIAGMIIIKDSAEAALTLPRTYGVDDFPLILQTKCFDVLYQIAIATAFDTVPMVNATMNSFLDAPAQVVRLRLLNGASDRSFNVGFSNNMNFYLIATDGGLINQPVLLNRLRLSNGERAEILVDLSSLQGQTIQLMSFGSELPNGIIGADSVGNMMSQIPDYYLNPLNGTNFNLLQLNVVAPTSNPVTTIPATLTTLTPLSQSQSNFTRVFNLAPQTMAMQEMVEGPFTMNGHQFSMDTINDTTYLNRIEIWTLHNQTLVAHPFHVHDVQFYITEFNGSLPPPEQQGKKDVVLVMPMQTVSFITKFEDFADTIPYMYHCHLLHHEDDGMMGSFIVVDSSGASVNENSETDFSIYPNPSDEIVTVQLPSAVKEDLKISITDFLGQTILKTSTSSSQQQYQLSTKNISNGIYFITLQLQNNRSVKKLIVQHS